MRTTVYGIAAWAVLVVTVQAADCRDLHVKNVFSGEFPQVLDFRGENSHDNPNYQAYSEELRLMDGSLKKLVPEEIDRIGPEFAQWANRYAREHPEILMLLHLDGQARQTHDHPEVQKRYFPGHWVYQPGALLTADADATSSVLHVSDTAPFKVKAYHDHRTGEWHPQDVLLVRMDRAGNRLWYDSEYVCVREVDARRNTITVLRARYGSSAVHHTQGDTYVAPLAAGVWGDKPMWYYNLSSACPKDRQGQVAADVFVQEIAEWFAPGGRLENIQGIAFDVNYWDVRRAGWDTNNDGQVDDGIVHDKNIWREGDWYFLGKVRKALGDRYVLTCDGQNSENQRAAGVLSGIESEGSVLPNDGFRGISTTINTHVYWKQNSPRSDAFRYIVLKLMNPADEKHGVTLRRMAAGLACCLEAAVARSHYSKTPMPEFSQGEENRRHWLGRPTGEMIRLACRAPDVLRQANSDISSFARRLTCENCSVSAVSSSEIEIAPKNPGKNLPMRVICAGLQVPAGDLTLYADVQAIDPLQGFAREDWVPRIASALMTGIPDYGEGKKNNALYTNTFGLFGTHKFTTVSFYFRRVRPEGGRINFALEFEGQGRVRMRMPSLYAGSETFAREFEHGVVLVNPSLDSYTFHLKSLFPNVTSYRHIKAQRPSSVHVAKHGHKKGSSEDEAKDIEEMAAYNNGEAIADPQSLTVPPLNALFLVTKR